MTHRKAILRKDIVMCEICGTILPKSKVAEKINDFDRIVCFCSECKNRNDRHSAMMEDAAWLGHTY